MSKFDSADRMGRAARLIIALALLSRFAIASWADPIVLDVKTKLSEKATLAPLKVGVEYLLLKSGSYAILDASEDYSVWLKSYRRERVGDSFKVSLLIALEPPTAFAEKELLASENLSFSFPSESAANFDSDDSVARFVREKLQRIGEVELAEARIGAPLAYEIINRLVKRIQARPSVSR